MRLEGNKAWAILLEDEKLAISLHHSSGKSSWQAGEIMQKAHYKYLEIKARAEKFFKMFHEYFTIYDDQLIPPSVILDRDFKLYLDLVIIKRNKIKEAISKIDNTSYKKTLTREVELSKHLNKLKRHPRPEGRNLFNLILDFDRWNNFRVIPRDMQEPSAFKRRNKNRYRKRVKKLMGLNEIAIEALSKNLVYKKKGKLATKLGYLPLITDSGEGHKILTVHLTKKNLDYISGNELYIFRTQEEAKKLVDTIFEFYLSEKRHCRDGQLFWPLYRDIVRLAINHDEVDKVIPQRKNYQDEDSIDETLARASKIKTRLNL